MTVDLDTLHHAALDALRLVLRGARKVALVNFPNHGNPGDPGLWLGTRALLRELGVKVGYQASPTSLDMDALARATGSNPVLINGGGNFGDLYQGQHGARLELLKRSHGRPIIQLPQSIQFEHAENADLVAQLIANQDDFTMMVRARRSQELSSQLLGVDAILSPDQIFGLHPLTVSAEIRHDILWMVWAPGAREFTPESQLANPPEHVHVEDWISGSARAHEHFDRFGQLAWAVNRKLGSKQSWANRNAWPLIAATFGPLAQRWFGRGVKMVAEANILVTNKLHGHLVATLLGKPHVVLDNSYGKVSGALDTWTRGLPGVNVAADAEEALRIAEALRE